MQGKIRKGYFKAHQALYGDHSEQIELLGCGASQFGQKCSGGLKKAVKRDCPTEQEEQIIAVTWCRKNNILVHHSPNGGYRDVREGAKFKRMGVSAGFPDLELPYMRKGHGGLYIELKRLFGGRLSDSQLFWRDHLIKEGYAWYEAKGAQEAIGFIRDYLWN